LNRHPELADTSYAVHEAELNIVVASCLYERVIRIVKDRLDSRSVLDVDFYESYIIEVVNIRVSKLADLVYLFETH
jgi:hypothetical protein